MVSTSLLIRDSPFSVSHAVSPLHCWISPCDCYLFIHRWLRFTGNFRSFFPHRKDTFLCYGINKSPVKVHNYVHGGKLTR